MGGACKGLLQQCRCKTYLQNPSKFEWDSGFSVFGPYKIRNLHSKVIICQSFYLTESANGKGTTSNQICTTKEWKRLWAIKTQPKMKIVLWRLAHSRLLTGNPLKMRHVPAPDTCFIAIEKKLHSMLPLLANMLMKFGENWRKDVA